MSRLLWLPVVAALAAAPSVAQSYQRPHAELPSTEQPTRNVPTVSYTLALSWSPEFCHSARGARAADPQCRGRSRSGFNLHGLWPDGAEEGRWPQYCRPVAILSDAQIKAGIGVTPSRQLLQHEWAKHGSCMGSDPTAYFSEETRLYRQIAIPDMAALARRRDLTAGDVAEAFARANPRLPAGAVRINANKRGWLEEVWLCLDRQRRFAACAPSQGGGAASHAPLKIETGARRY